MRKSTLIATCFANSLHTTVEHGERVVRNHYDDKPRPESFDQWNTVVSDDFAKELIKQRSGAALWFNVERFIDELS